MPLTFRCVFLYATDIRAGVYCRYTLARFLACRILRHTAPIALSFFAAFLLQTQTVQAAAVNLDAASYRVYLAINECTGFDCNQGETAHLDIAFSGATLLDHTSVENTVQSAIWGINSVSARFTTASGQTAIFPFSIVHTEGSSPPDPTDSNDIHVLHVVDKLSTSPTPVPLPNFPNSGDSAGLDPGSPASIDPDPDFFALRLEHRDDFGLVATSALELFLDGTGDLISEPTAAASNWPLMDLSLESVTTRGKFVLDGREAHFQITAITNVPLPGAAWLFTFAVASLVSVQTQKKA